MSSSRRVEQAHASYPVAVDAENKLGAALGYAVVPTGIFVDENGAVRHLQAGDFTVSNEHTVTLIDRFLAGDADVLAELSVQSRPRVGRLEQELIDAKIRLASELLGRGNKDEALAELDRALELDPENFLIRKQRWNLRYPERFEPEVDYDWQDEQLAHELEAERRLREADCGPDGCVIPPRPSPSDA